MIIPNRIHRGSLRSDKNSYLSRIYRKIQYILGPKGSPTFISQSEPSRKSIFSNPPPPFQLRGRRVGFNLFGIDMRSGSGAGQGVDVDYAKGGRKYCIGYVV